MNFKRSLSLEGLDTSAFLFGCRQAGKTWLLKNTLTPDIYIDLLKYDELFRYTATPELVYAEAEALGKRSPLVVIDEIQKIPGLLDEVQRSIESEFSARFILTGSSARKLKRAHANMLGGRAVTLRLFPLSYVELADQFDLTTHLQFGGLPRVALNKEPRTKKRLLDSYVSTYLKEEVMDEALVRNLPAFSKFLEFAGHENGNILNYSAISNQIGITSATVKEYFQILEDSLLGFTLPSFQRSPRQRLVKHPKFYFVDTGLTFALRKMLTIELSERSPLYGKTFEHFIILETQKAINYIEEEINPSFFLTSDGAEVDLILEKHGEIIPIEIKSSTRPKVPTGLRSFLRDHSTPQALCVCRTPRAYRENGITFIPWQDYIQTLYTRGLFQASRIARSRA